MPSMVKQYILCTVVEIVWYNNYNMLFIKILHQQYRDNLEEHSQAMLAKPQTNLHFSRANSQLSPCRLRQVISIATGYGNFNRHGLCLIYAELA